MHVAAVAGEAFAGFGHEAGGYAMFCAEGFDSVSIGERFVSCEELEQGGRETKIGRGERDRECCGILT